MAPPRYWTAVRFQYMCQARSSAHAAKHAPTCNVSQRSIHDSDRLHAPSLAVDKRTPAARLSPWATRSSSTCCGSCRTLARTWSLAWPATARLAQVTQLLKRPTCAGSAKKLSRVPRTRWSWLAERGAGRGWLGWRRHRDPQAFALRTLARGCKGWPVAPVQGWDRIELAAAFNEDR